MAQKPDGKPAKTERVYFTKPAAERIAKVVRTIEAGDKKAAPLYFSKKPSTAAASPLRLATFTGSWATATYKTVTLAGSNATASVLNACSPVAEAACERTVVFSTIGGTQVAVEMQYRPTCATCHINIQGFDLSTLPDYSGSAIQILGHDASGCLRWYPVYECT